MALIKCPECGKEVSDKAKSCIHCGYPLEAVYLINGTCYDMNFLLEKQWEFFVDAARAIWKVYPKCDATKTKKILLDLRGKGLLKIINVNNSNNNPNIPKCPRCGSTAITAGQRGFSIVTGFWGSSATVNRCSNCGYKWKPKAN